MTLLDFVHLTRAHLRLIVGCFLLGVLLAAAYTFTRPVLYTSTATGQVYAGSSSSIAGAMSGLSLASSKAQSYASYADGQLERDEIVKQLGNNVPFYSLNAESNASTAEIVFTAVSSSPANAQRVADASVKALAAVAQNIEQRTLSPQERGSKPVVWVQPLENASLPTSPSSPNWRRNLLAGAVAGLVLGYLLTLVKRSLDRRIRHVGDVEELVGKSALTVLPEVETLNRGKKGGLETSSRGPGAEALRQLRTNLRFVEVDNPPRSLVITSANPGEGKSTVAANLARLLALAETPTLLVDADLRRPVVAEILELDGQVGLTQVLAGDVEIADAIVGTSELNLFVLASGRVPPNPSELLGSQRMAHLLKELSSEYMVILDAPPLLPVSDAGLLSGIADGTLLVLEVGSTYKEQARLAAQRLHQVGGHLIGAILNKAPMKGIGAVMYGDGYGYKAYSSEYDYYGQPGGAHRPAKSGVKASKNAKGLPGRKPSRRS